jgi:hypothetical protein
MTDPYNPFIEREGISPLRSKDSSVITRRVEKIGALNDRYKACVAEHDALGLLRLAEDYDNCNHMHRTANLIRLEAAEMEKIS